MPLSKEDIYTSEDYWSLPEGKRAELIDGRLYSMAPPSRMHQELISEFTQAIGGYIKSHDSNCKVYPAPFAVNLDTQNKNWVEPDISVICDKSKLTDRGCQGAPDWIIEVSSPSSQSHDYLKKLWLYQKSNVKEYWIVNPKTESVMVYTFFEDSAASYSFEDTIPVGIYNGSFSVRIADLLS